MKIVVLNGSPKGDLSATMQYVLYAQKKMPEHEFKILNVANKIKSLENNQEKFQEIIEEVNSSNGIIWGFPLYVMLVSSQYKRFIELVFERNAVDAFKNKHAAVVATSIKFYDHTAINYMNAICDDLDMKFTSFFSADMYDLIRSKERAQWLLFVEDFLHSIENNIFSMKHFLPVREREFIYNPSKVEKADKITIENKKILVVSDAIDENSNLGKMIHRFQDCFSNQIEIINIYDVDIKGGCLGCIQCGYDNQCIYFGKDGHREFWNEKLKKADILVFAGIIKDRYLSSRWKMVLDRGFFNNHIPTLIRKQIGFIISGPLSQTPNLTQILQAYGELQDSNLVDIITDEHGDSSDLDLVLLNLARSLVRSSKSEYVKPQTFLGVGGKLLFRDEVYGRMRFVFQADHRYYEEHGYYNTFPQNDKVAKKMNDMFIPATQDEDFRKKFYARLTKEMIKPLKNVVRKAK